MKSTHTSSPITDKSTLHMPTSQSNFPVSSGDTPSPIRGWMLFPQRLFLGATFVYAGVQKLTDPQFFHKGTPGYIGNQIIGFAQGSPLHFLLVKVVISHAVLFGWAVALGELAIGLGTLVGLFFRPASFFGIVLSILFLLTASWHVYPYFYGADIVFGWSWLTLFLVGPVGTGLPTLDGWLQRVFFPQGAARRGLIGRTLGVLILGMNTWRADEPEAFRKGAQQQRFSASQQQREKRRTFLQGLAVGSVSMAGLAFLGSVLHVFGRPDVATASDTASGSGAAGAGKAASGTYIAQVKAVPVNGAVNFTIPGTGDPGVLIHLSEEQFVAFDATCTHAGCEVGYDPGSKLLVCPCHGAQFDPAHQGAVMQGPAQLPLTAIKVHVDAVSGAIILD